MEVHAIRRPGRQRAVPGVGDPALSPPGRPSQVHPTHRIPPPSPPRGQLRGQRPQPLGRDPLGRVEDEAALRRGPLDRRRRVGLW
ncbi:hypothetical protein ACU686_02215 [Yinghuangia aomiensis]